MSTLLSRLQLVVCLTRGGSLGQWQKSGLLTREMALYRTMLPHLAGISIVSYGDDPPFGELDGMQLVGNRWGLKTASYQHWLEWLPRSWCWQKTIFKSNQLLGAELPVALAKRWRKPAIVRCGYPFGRFRQHHHGADSPLTQQARLLEKDCFWQADQIILTTQTMADNAVADYGLLTNKIRVIPNYVDCTLFAPPPQPANNSVPHILFIGRLEEQKNLSSLLTALAGLPVKTTLLGDGPLRQELMEQAQRLAVDVTFLPRRSHHELPILLQHADIFILPSHYEGHPKALIEAMACGLPVIGCQVAGVADLLQHNITGLLSPPTPDGLRQALQTLLANPSLRQELGERACRYVGQHFSLPKVAEMELSLLEEMVASRWPEIHT